MLDGDLGNFADHTSFDEPTPTSATTPGQQENFNTITEQQEHFKELRSNLKTRNHRRHLLQGGNGAVNIEGEKVEAGRRRHLLTSADGEGS